MKVLFCDNRNPWLIGADLIKMFDGDRMSHVALQINNDLIVHSNSHRLNLINQRYFFKNYKTVYEIQVPLDEEKVMGYLSCHLGAPFGYMPIVGIALIKLFNLERNIFDDKDKSFHCTEFIHNVFRLHDIKLDFYPHLQGLKELKQALLEQGYSCIGY